MSCGTCVNFRASLVGGVGYCALDRRREALTGAEQRPCWQGAIEPAADGLFVLGEAEPVPSANRGLIDISQS